MFRWELDDMEMEKIDGIIVNLCLKWEEVDMNEILFRTKSDVYYFIIDN